jgi:hypothetical protein
MYLNENAYYKNVLKRFPSCKSNNTKGQRPIGIRRMEIIYIIYKKMCFFVYLKVFFFFLLLITTLFCKPQENRLFDFLLLCNTLQTH